MTLHPVPDESWLRTIDANLNRTNEALRVVEDCLRFVVEDPYLTSECKSLRHCVTEWASRFRAVDLVSMRDASGDIGRTSSVEQEYSRSGMLDVLRANFSRASQSLRVLEEFSKLEELSIPGSEKNQVAGNADFAQNIEQARYRVYDLEKATLTTFDSSQRLENVRLYVLLDSQNSLENYTAIIGQLVAGGADAIQLREKSLEDRQLFEYAKRLVELTRPHNVLSIINDRLDVAIAVQADGVHLGQEDIPIARARQMAGPRLLIGVSTHSLVQAKDAVMAGANYIGVGPSFPSTTKQFVEFKGVGLLRDVAGSVSIPAFAIGGINLDNISQVIDNGFRRIAVSGALVSDALVRDKKIEASTRALKKAIKGV